MAKLKHVLLLLIPVLLVNSGESFEDLSTECPSLTKLQVLPGRGWDSLTNTDMRQVIRMSYSKCKTTLDGKFLIPDNVDAIPVSETAYDISSEFMEHWTNFTSVTAQSFKAHSGGTLEEYFVTLQGSFSREYEQVKKHQVEERSSLVRVFFKTTAYALRTSPKDIDADLRTVLNEALQALENDNDEQASILLQFVVRDYGTHVLTKADAGAILLKEDYVAIKGIRDHWSRRSAIAAAAKIDFINMFGLKSQFKDEKDALAANEYQKMRISTSTRAVGGMFTPGMSLQQWIDQVQDNFVTIDRSGDPLSFIVTPNIFPDASANMLHKLRKRLDNVILQYYSVNTHYGCTKLDSENFDYSANADDGSCDAPSNNYSFGGLYQICNSLQSDAGNLCDDLLQVNPLTGDYSCPMGYTNTQLHSATQQKTTSVQKCNEKCSGWWFWKKCWQECYYDHPTSSALYTSHWCVAAEAVIKNSGFMFGGLYSLSLSNPVTRTKACPSHFIPLRMGPEIKICVSSDYETGFKFSVPFGGFFSCSNGNPLARLHPDSDAISTRVERMKTLDLRLPQIPPIENRVLESHIHNHGCPGGYSQHSAGLLQGCQVNYCVKAATFGKKSPVPITRPPFGATDALFASTTALKGSNKISSLNIGIIVSLCLLLVLVTACLVFYYRKRVYSSVIKGDTKFGAQISNSLGQIRDGFSGIRSAVFASKV